MITVTRAQLTPEQVSDVADQRYTHVCRDCARGVDVVESTATGFRHRAHREGESDWQCPRTPLPPFGIPNPQKA
jgi:hypothetical protein